MPASSLVHCVPPAARRVQHGCSAQTTCRLASTVPALSHCVSLAPRHGGKKGHQSKRMQPELRYPRCALIIGWWRGCTHRADARGMRTRLGLEIPVIIESTTSSYIKNALEALSQGHNTDLSPPPSCFTICTGFDHAHQRPLLTARFAGCALLRLLHPCHCKQQRSRSLGKPSLDASSTAVIGRPLAQPLPLL